ncbi:MAG: formylglycine-generating enzyme family protein [Chitinispirillia bacterium]|nr:formylglycine-generating enzyme family protein [Chitinispirillia bacterium]MCL2267753.1 formylglycine-generating enzyme family protein [Chitinispirillia bacterium]
MNSKKIALGFAVVSGIALCVLAGCGGRGGGKDITIFVVGVPLEMEFVVGGTLTVGCTPEPDSDCDADEKTSRQIALDDFYIGRYQVTQLQWRTVMGNNPSRVKNDNLPVDNVGEADIRTFITHLNITTGKSFRLPTEAEWEYAARRGGRGVRLALSP